MHDHTLDDWGLRTRGGLYLPAARLRLDGSPGPGLRWLPGWDGRRHRGDRLLCAGPLATVLACPSPPMAVPYATPFQLGKLALELLPSGTGWGDSMLRFKLGETTVLAAPSARLDALPGVPPLTWREADILLLHAPDHQERADVAGLAAFVDDAVAAVAAGKTVTLACDELPVALAAWTLAGVSTAGGAAVPVQPSVQLVRWANRHRAAGLGLPTEHAVPRGRAARLRIALTGRSSAAPARSAELRRIGPAVTEGLAFTVHASGPALVALAAASGARHVRVWGDGAAAAVEAMRRAGLDAAVLTTERQLPLV